MKSRISKLTAWLLTLAMLMTFIPSFTALAADNTYPYAVVDTEAGTVTIDGTLGGKTTAEESDITALVEQFKYYVDNGITTIIVTGSNPAMIDMGNYTSIAIGEAIYRWTDMNKDSPYCGTIDLILPDVTEIVEWGFYGAFALNSITIPKVTKLGDQAFYGTPYLQTITFGSVLTEVNETGGVMFYQVGKNVGGCDLILNCGQMNESSVPTPGLTTNIWRFRYDNEFKSITLTHDDSEHTTTTDNGDGTHSFTCTVCGNIEQSPHDWSDKNGTCKTCGYTCDHGGENATYDNGICDICGKVLETIIVKYDKDKKIATVTAKESGTYSLIFAKYGEGNRLDKIDIVNFTFEKGENTVPQEIKDFTLGTGDKIMLWQDMTNLVPLCEAYIVK